jgi:hypothetical protein
LATLRWRATGSPPESKSLNNFADLDARFWPMAEIGSGDIEAPLEGSGVGPGRRGGQPCTE